MTDRDDGKHTLIIHIYVLISKMGSTSPLTSLADSFYGWTLLVLTNSEEKSVVSKSADLVY